MVMITTKNGVENMSKIINVLEQMGRNTNYQNEDTINNLLATAELDIEISAAIINKDITSLEHQLDVRPDVVCMILPAEDDEGDEGDDSTEITNYRVIGF